MCAGERERASCCFVDCVDACRSIIYVAKFGIFFGISIVFVLVVVSVSVILLLLFSICAEFALKNRRSAVACSICHWRIYMSSNC